MNRMPKNRYIMSLYTVFSFKNQKSRRQRERSIQMIDRAMRGNIEQVWRYNKFPNLLLCVCFKVCVCERDVRTVLFIVDLECRNPKKRRKKKKTDSRRRKRSMTLYSVKECQHAAPLTSGRCAEKRALPPPRKSGFIGNHKKQILILLLLQYYIQFVLSQAKSEDTVFSVFF